MTCLDLFFAVKAKKRKVEQIVDEEEMAVYPAEEQGEASQEAAEDNDSDSDDSSDDDK